MGELMLVCGIVAVLLSPTILIEASPPCGTIQPGGPSGQICGMHEPLDLSDEFKTNARAGGLELEAKYFPSFVRLEFRGKRGARWSIPGVLLIDRYVLTHQYNWQRAKVYGPTSTGAYSWTAKATLGLGSESETKIEIETDCPLHMPAAWVIDYDDDMILFRLKEKVDYDQNIQPACWYLHRPRWLTAEMQAFLVVSSAMDRPNETDDSSDGRDDDEEFARRPRGLRVLPVRRKTPCLEEREIIPMLCAQPNLPQYLGGPCREDIGAPLLATIDGRQHVFGFLGPVYENCQANKSYVDIYRTGIQQDKNICFAADNCEDWLGK